MKKEWFVFLESVVVLVVVMLALTMLLLTYSLISRRTEEKEDYNKSSDIYLLYSINKMGATEKEYYKATEEAKKLDKVGNKLKGDILSGEKLTIDKEATAWT